VVRKEGLWPGLARVSCRFTPSPGEPGSAVWKYGHNYRVAFDSASGRLHAHQLSAATLSMHCQVRCPLGEHRSSALLTTALVRAQRAGATVPRRWRGTR
jgi:hypothetical protein